MDTSHYTEYRPLMFSIAYRMTGSVGDAEDIVQEVFLRAGQDAAPDGPAAVRKAAAEVLGTPADPALELDYLAIVDPDTFEEAGEDYAGPARLLVAARVGTTRLIDNTPLSLECHAADD